MRISLIHGEDSIKAYERYRELIDSSKKKGFEIIQIVSVKDIVAQSLFEDKIVFTLDKPNKVKLNDWKWLAKNAPKYNSNLLIYYEGNAPLAVTKNLPKESKLQKFDLPKIIFAFLDNFYPGGTSSAYPEGTSSAYPGNSKKCLVLLDALVRDEPIELIFHLLSRQVRDLYWAKTSKETMPIPDWRVLKLARQADKFEGSDLKSIINKLSNIDIKAKTSDEDLKKMLDLLIVKELK